MTATTTAVATARPERLAHPAVALGWIARFGARSVLVYRSEVLVGAVALLVRVLLVTLVWRAVYGDRTTVSGVSEQHAVAYAVLGAILGNVLNPWQFSTLQTRIRSGTVAIDLLRPVGLVPQTLSQQVGVTASAVPRAVLAVLLGIALGALVLPDAGPLAVVAVVISVALGIAIALILNLIVAMTAFWTTEINGALMVYRAVAQFGSGALIPLWFMPGWLRGVLEWLPFQAQVFTPLSIYFGETRGLAVLGTLAGQAAWLVVLAFVAQAVWLRAMRRVVVLGG